MKRLPGVFRISAMWTLAAALLGISTSRAADETEGKELESELSSLATGDWIRSAVGVTRMDTPIPCFLSEESLDPNTRKHRILVIGGLEGELDSMQTAIEIAHQLRKEETIAVACIPSVQPESLDSDKGIALSFPPDGVAYHQPESDVANYLWRWIGMHSPDLVIVSFSEKREATDSLLAALSDHFPCEIGTIPAGKYSRASAQSLKGYVGNLVQRPPEISPARTEIQRRIARTPIEVAEELAAVYGQELDRVQYIPALALNGRLRLGELTGNPSHLKEIRSIVAPFQTGAKESMPSKGNGSTLSGHLVFAELARHNPDDRWVNLVRKAADYGFAENGEAKDSMPFHNEMSDSVFMGCAILAEAGRLTGEEKYYEQCLRHLRFIEDLCLRDDGLYRHSPLDEAAWGRGNGFPALGMALSLSTIPGDREEHAPLLAAFRAHLEALRRHQDPTGAWHQVIDHEESYREFTCTCMITFAIVRGMRRGWLDPAEWQPVVDRAWTAIKSRVGPSGRLVDVCTGTGKQKNLRAYFDRTAILGTDDRGGAMALMVSTELAYWEREQKSR